MEGKSLRIGSTEKGMIQPVGSGDAPGLCHVRQLAGYDSLPDDPAGRDSLVGSDVVYGPAVGHAEQVLCGGIPSVSNVARV